MLNVRLARLRFLVHVALSRFLLQMHVFVFSCIWHVCVFSCKCTFAISRSNPCLRSFEQIHIRDFSSEFMLAFHQAKAHLRFIVRMHVRVFVAQMHDNVSSSAGACAFQRPQVRVRFIGRMARWHFYRANARVRLIVRMARSRFLVHMARLRFLVQMHVCHFSFESAFAFLRANARSRFIG